MTSSIDKSMRYDRQVAFKALGETGQRALGGGMALLVGLGGLGSHAASLLARAGVGTLRLVDPDRVDWTNLHRQALFTEPDASAGAAKVEAAAKHLKKINSEVSIEPIADSVNAANIERLAGGVDVILDGTDNFATRFIINDFAVKFERPWVFAGVLQAGGQVMPVLPRRTACLRCVYESPPDNAETCVTAGVLGPAVAAVAALLAGEALKILAGQLDRINPYLTRLDLWNNTVQRIDARPRDDCPCCRKLEFEFLEA